MQIAKRYGSSVDRILRVNGLRKANLRVGSTLLVPKL
jgi:LysM repeat protein